VAVNHVNYTHKLIEETSEFVLAFPNENMENIIRCTGSCSGRNTDKFAVCGIETLVSKHVKPPLIRDAVACFECKVTGRLVTGDHTIFAGEVVASYVSSKYKDRLYNFCDDRFRIIQEK